MIYKAQVHIVQVQCKCDKLLRYIAKFTCNALMLLSWFCFRHCSGKTQFQATSMTQARRSVRFERKPSQRYSRRPKFEKKESDMAATTSDLLPSTSEQRYSQLLISSSKLFLVFILLLLFSGDIHWFRNFLYVQGRDAVFRLQHDFNIYWQHTLLSDLNQCSSNWSQCHLNLIHCLLILSIDF